MCIWLNICLCLSCWCIFVWTILSQTPQQSPQVMYDAGRISAWIFWLSLNEPRMLRKQDYQGRFSFHFFKGEWQILPLTGRKKNIVLKNIADARILPFYMELNGTDLLCTKPLRLGTVPSIRTIAVCYIGSVSFPPLVYLALGHFGLI